MISNREEENEEDETGPELEEYKIQAEALKDQGNEAFQAGNTDLAIAYFSNAIDIDPDNHVVHSKSPNNLINQKKSSISLSPCHLTSTIAIVLRPI